MPTMRAQRLVLGLSACVGLLAVLAVPAAWAKGALELPAFSKVFTCTACHGVGGNSQSDSMPTIAGLHPAYFKKQIEAYAAGKRPSPEMEPYAKMVVHLGADDIAGYFAKQKMQPTPVKADPAAVERGRAASAQCAACHGPAGKGDPAKGIPSLAGQPPGFLRDQMLLFRADRRNPGDATLKAIKAIMATIPEATYADLAAYYSSLR